MQLLRSGVHDTSAVNNALAMSDAMKGQVLTISEGMCREAQPGPPHVPIQPITDV